MKKYFVLFALLAIVAACNSSSDSSGSSDSASSSSSADANTNPDYQKGLALISTNDCLGCHKVDEKLTGPAYVDVANKYAGNDTAVAYLAHRIINGVGANDKKDWGTETNDAIMTPHPSLSEADAEAMVKYILLLKK